MLKRLWREDEGFLTFEWIMLLTLLVIGVIGGVAGIRDAIIHECQGVVGAMVSLDQSYYIAPPLGVSVTSLNSGADTSNNCTSSGSQSAFVDTGVYNTNRVNITNPMEPVDNGTLCPVTF